MLDNRLLMYFQTVAELGSFSAAAQYLNTTQSNLSKQIQDFEKSIGKQLFIRGKKGVELTLTGKYLYRKMLLPLSRLEEIEKQLLSSHLVAGEINIGCDETSGTDWLCRVGEEYRKENQAVFMNYFSGPAALSLNMLEEGMLDVALVPEFVNDAGFEYIEIPLEDTFCIIMNSEDELASREILSASDIMGLPLYHPSQAYLGKYYVDKLGIGSEKLNIIGLYNLSGCVTELVRNGSYILTVTQPEKYKGRAGLACVPIECGRKLYGKLVYKAGEARSPLLQSYIQWIRQSLEEVR